MVLIKGMPWVKLQGAVYIKALSIYFLNRKVDHSLLSGNIFLNGEKMTKKSRLVSSGQGINK